MPDAAFFSVITLGILFLASQDGAGSWQNRVSLSVSLFCHTTVVLPPTPPPPVQHNYTRNNEITNSCCCSLHIYVKLWHIARAPEFGSCPVKGAALIQLAISSRLFFFLRLGAWPPLSENPTDSLLQIWAILQIAECRTPKPCAEYGPEVAWPRGCVLVGEERGVTWLACPPLCFLIDGSAL